MNAKSCVEFVLQAMNNVDNQKMQTILGSEEIKNVLEKELKWID